MPPSTPPKPKSPRDTWAALEQQARDAEIARFVAMPRAEVDARLRAAGEDPDAIRAEGVALATKLLADRDRLAWQVAAAEGLARAQARFDARPRRYAGLSLSELRARLAVARNDPRLSAPVTIMFRNRKVEEASEDELRAILEEIDALAERDE